MPVIPFYFLGNCDRQGQLGTWSAFVFLWKQSTACTACAGFLEVGRESAEGTWALLHVGNLCRGPRHKGAQHHPQSLLPQSLFEDPAFLSEGH